MQYINYKFEHFYVKGKEEGAFSYYPGEKKASLDGSSFIGDLRNYGYCSAERQAKLWSWLPSVEVKEYNISSFTKADFHMMLDVINSVRFYAVDPRAENSNNRYINNVIGVFYPNETNVLDAMELIPNMQNWLANPTTPDMGNWTSKEYIKTVLDTTGIKLTTILPQNLPVEELNDVLQKNKKLVLVGFDKLQIPIVEDIYNYTTPERQ